MSELRVALRGLRKAPGFTWAAVTVLGLGIGIVTLMFSLINTLTVRGPAFEDAERLVGMLKTLNHSGRADGVNGLSIHDFLAVRESQTSFEAMGAYDFTTVSVRGDGQTQRHEAAFVSPGFFTALRVKPLLGRTLIPSDARPGAAPTLILGHDLWRTRFNADPAILGRSLFIDERSYIVAGVMPPGFDFPLKQALWIPLNENVSELDRGQGPSVFPIARLKNGISIADAQRDLTHLAKRLEVLYPKINAGVGIDVLPLPMSLTGRDLPQKLHGMLAAVFLVLLLACSNTASLLLVRASARLHETGLRRALGASRFRLMTGLLAEAFLISAAGVLVGVWIAAVGMDALGRFVMTRFAADAPSWWQFDVDRRAMLFACALGAFSTLVAGWLPAWCTARADIAGVLREGGHHETGARRSWLTRALVTAEVAVTCVLLMSAGTLIQGALLAVNKDPGVITAPFLTAGIILPATLSQTRLRQQFIEDLSAELAAVPGIEAVAVGDALPGVRAQQASFAAEGRTFSNPAQMPVAHIVNVSESYFSTFGINIESGRGFDSHDTESTPSVVVVNRALAESAWPGRNPLGQRIQLSPDSRQWLTVIGVSANVRYGIPQEQTGQAKPVVYTPLTQAPASALTLILRVAGEPYRYANTLRQIVHRVNPDVALDPPFTIADWRIRFAAALVIFGSVLGFFAMVAVILAGIGIYGIVAYAVTMRSREIAIRRSLGAKSRHITELVTRTFLGQLIVGLGAGLLITPLITRRLSIGPQAGELEQAIVYGIVLAMLILCIVAATVVPLRRALGVQPAIALRAE